MILSNDGLIGSKVIKNPNCITFEKIPIIKTDKKIGRVIKLTTTWNGSKDFYTRFEKNLAQILQKNQQQDAQ